MMPAAIADPTILLARALRLSAQAAGVTMFVVGSAERDWASATFAGVRHRLDLAVEPGARLDAWLKALPNADLRLRGHLVADLTVDRRDGTIVLDVLTLRAD